MKTLEERKIKVRINNNDYIKYLPVKERKFEKVKVKIIRHENIGTD